MVTFESSGGIGTELERVQRLDKPLLIRIHLNQLHYGTGMVLRDWRSSDFALRAESQSDTLFSASPLKLMS